MLGKCEETDLKAKGYIYVILGIILENLEFKQNNEIMDAKLSLMILDYVNANFSGNITLHSTAMKFGYNASYISRYFKACFNIGFYQYLTSVRLKNALMLMNEKKHTIIHCAMESGFNSLRTFHRAFKKEFCCTPNEYMKKILVGSKLC